MEVVNIVERTKIISHSILVALSPTSNPVDRLEAHKICDTFQKNSSPNEITLVAFALIENAIEPELVLSGYQFLEFVVKFHWNGMKERDEIKDKLLDQMIRGSQRNQSTGYLREALTRVVVEIAKREWPQLWPNLFPKLCEIANSSDLPLLVLRRLAEDVVILQNVDCIERRRDLNQSLNLISAEVVATLFNVLVNSVQKFKAPTTSPQEASVFQRRGKICLECMLPYIEWVDINWFINENRVSILYTLLKEHEFQLEAADCIIQLLERKPNKKDEQIPVLCLEEPNTASFLQAIQSCKENGIDFLKKCGEILNLLASSSASDKINRDNLLKCISFLALRPEPAAAVVSAISANHFLKFMDKKIELIQDDSYIATYYKNLFNQIIQRLTTAPPGNKMEHARLKSEFGQMLRSYGKKAPKLYEIAHVWLISNLTLTPSLTLERIMQNWECLGVALDAIASTVPEDQPEIIKLGLQDLNFCLEKFIAETKMEMKSVILSGISSLFVFLSLAQKRSEFGEEHLLMMKSILESMFKCFLVEDSNREIRRHCTSLLIKLGVKYPQVLALVFDYIQTLAQSVSPGLSTMEHVNIIESMILISNAWENPETQSQFIGSVLTSGKWSEVQFLAQSQANLIGIFQENIFFEKRAILLSNISILQSVLKRVSYKNKIGPTQPVFAHVKPLLPIILQLIKTLHCLTDNPLFTFFFEMNEQEKNHILGNPGSNPGNYIPTSVPAFPSTNASGSGSGDEKPFPEKIKTFIQNLLETCYVITGDTCYIFSSEIYTIPQLGDAYLSYIGWNLQKMNDFRVRNIIKFVYRPFLLSCPFEHSDLIVKPFIKSFAPFMMDRLLAHWAHEERSKTEGEGEEEKEVLESSALRMLTKEYFELLERIVSKTKGTGNSNSHSRSNSEHRETDGIDGEMMDEADSRHFQNGGSGPHITYNQDQMGEIGETLLDDPICFRSIIQLCINTLCWSDSTISLKGARILVQSWKKLSQNLEVVRETFISTLRALCLWSDHEGIFDMLCRIHDLIFLEFHSQDQIILKLMVDWGAPQEDVTKMIVMAKDLSKPAAKRRRELLRRLVRNNPSLESNKSQNAQWLHGLPRLNLRNEAKAQKKLAAEQPVDLNECFSYIHS